MPQSLTIGALEEALWSHFRTCDPYPKFVDLDLSECQFIELVALVHLIALIADRTRKGLATRIVVPKSKDVRDFMRVWNFPDAIRDATGIPLSKLVAEENLSYFGENSELATVRYAQACGYEGGLQRMLSSRFFAITSFLTALPSQPRFALSESRRWQETLVRSVLARYLRGPDNYVASRIVFEAATNAVRHPGAKIILTASTFLIPRRAFTVRGTLATLEGDLGRLSINTAKGCIDLVRDLRTTYFRQVPTPGTRSRRKRIASSELALGQSIAVRTRMKVYGQPLTAVEVTLLHDQAETYDLATRTDPDPAGDAGYLTIVFWDDGQSIVDTLKEAIVSGKKIQSIQVPDLYANFELQQCDHRGIQQSTETINSSYVPDRTAAEHLLLLAATFPGITRDVSGEGRDHNIESQTNHVLESPGMGLYVLLNTVIDVFGGSVFFRTKHFGMSVKKAPTNTGLPSLRYLARVRHIDAHVPPLLGNMVIIHLPIREQEP